MARVILKNVTKIYKGNCPAIKDINLICEDNEFLVLHGPGSCGKSTILRIIAGLEEASEGDIYIDDKLVNDVPAKDRDIDMVFQNYALYPHMSVYGNMAFGLKLKKLPKDEIKHRVLEAADILDINEILYRKTSELSGSHRQLVAIGRAVVRQAKVILFDEPWALLPLRSRLQIRWQLKNYHSRLQSTIIYATNNQEEAMTLGLGNRIAAMGDGLIHQIADPFTLYQQPNSKFVAGFIGTPSMNL